MGSYRNVIFDNWATILRKKIGNTQFEEQKNGKR